MDSKVLIGGLQMGALWANQLGTVLGKDDKLGTWDDRKLCIALIVYAASLASATDLSESEFLDFTTAAFRGIELDRLDRT
jgi:hypothetical protein